MCSSTRAGEAVVGEHLRRAPEGEGGLHVGEAVAGELCGALLGEKEVSHAGEAVAGELCGALPGGKEVFHAMDPADERVEEAPIPSSRTPGMSTQDAPRREVEEYMEKHERRRSPSTRR
jgi:hypothetical protein